MAVDYIMFIILFFKLPFSERQQPLSHFPKNEMLRSALRIIQPRVILTRFAPRFSSTARPGSAEHPETTMKYQQFGRHIINTLGSNHIIKFTV
jgi:hypothetical protein